MALYDTIGEGYSTTRAADDRIARMLCESLGLRAGATVLDVGAGSGHYARAMADCGYRVLAIEPSEVMRSQNQAHPRVRMIPAAAEAIPLRSGSADGAFIVLALHHFKDRKRAIDEILRIIRCGPLVVFSFEPRLLGRFWLAEYFPTLGREECSSFSNLESGANEVAALTRRPVRIIPFPLPFDLKDGFAAAGWAQPERYLNPTFRKGISSFAMMNPDEAAAGLSRLESDLASGRWDEKHGSLRCQSHLDIGYHFVVAENRAPVLAY